MTGLVRPSSRRDHIEPWVERFVVGDHSDEGCWGALLDGAECVVHNSLDWQLLSGRKSDFDVHLQTNLVGSLRLLKASAPRQFIFVSTIAVHHDMRPRWGGLGGGKFVHVEDVAATISAIVGNEAAAGKAYNLADCYARWVDWARLAGELLHVDVQIDFSSPEHSKNRFVKDAAASLGIPLDRGHEGIRRHLVKLIDVMPPS